MLLILKLFARDVCACTAYQVLCQNQLNLHDKSVSLSQL